MNNQYKPLPTPVGIPGVVNNPNPNPGEKIANTVSECMDVNPNGVDGSVTYTKKPGGDTGPK